jgi:hypothetical protein
MARVAVLGQPLRSHVRRNRQSQPLGRSEIKTELNIKEGQKLVIGKLRNQPTDRGMFVVVSATVEWTYEEITSL